MAHELTQEFLRAVFPRAPQPALDSFLKNQKLLDDAGINATPQRLALFFANLAHETAGLTVLKENIYYTHAGVARTWKNRFPGGEAEVIARFGSAPGWQKAMLDEVYGSRMGNRPGTRDGSSFIGRGGPQWTGREAYGVLAKMSGLDVLAHPELAERPELQAQVSAPLWTWKKMNEVADGDFSAAVERVRVRWNGGTNGLAEVRRFAANILPIAQQLPGRTPGRATETVIVVAGGGGAAGTAKQMADSGWSTEVIVGVAAAIMVVTIVAAVLVAKLKRRKR